MRSIPKLAAAAAITALGVAGCTAAPSGGEEESARVLYLLPTLDDEAYSREAAGAEAEALQYDDLEVDVQAATDRSDPAELIAKIENAVTQQYDVIAIDPAGLGEQLAPALTAAAAAGVHIITVVQPVPGFEPDTKVTFDQVPAYVEAGEYMGELLPDGGEIGVIGCAIGNSDMDSRRNGFAEGLPDNITQVAIGDAVCNPTEARKIAENMLTANPNLAGIFSDTDIALLGVIEGLRAIDKDLALIGGDGQSANLELIAAGDYQDATTRYPSESFGALAVKLAKQIMDGEDVPAEVQVPNLPLITTDNAADVLQEIKDIAAGTATPELP